MHVRARQVTCSFTGHRPEKLPWGEDESDIRCAELKERLFDAVLAAYDQGYRHFLCGMARGSDFWFCEAVLRLQEIQTDVSLEAVIPFLGQAPPYTSLHTTASHHYLYPHIFCSDNL